MGAVGTCVEVRVVLRWCGLNADNGKTGFDLQEEIRVHDREFWSLLH